MQVLGKTQRCIGKGGFEMRQRNRIAGAGRGLESRVEIIGGIEAGIGGLAEGLR